MNTWLNKFRISSAHDSGKPLPASLSRAIDASPELSRFAEQTRELEHTLVAARPQLEVPPALHRSIMRSVQAAAEQPAPVGLDFLRLRWLAAPGFAVVLAVVLWVALKPPPAPPDTAPLATVSATLELGSDMPRTLPPALVSPLSDELDHLNHDLSDTAQFLMASVP